MPSLTIWPIRIQLSDHPTHPAYPPSTRCRIVLDVSLFDSRPCPRRRARSSSASLSPDGGYNPGSIQERLRECAQTCGLGVDSNG